MNTPKLTILFLACSFILSCSSGDKPIIEPQVTDSQETDEWLSFSGRDSMPNIVLVSGDEEYRSEEALPMLARILSQHHGFNCTVLFAQDPANPGIIDPNYTRNIPGLSQLEEADLLILFTRFRALPDDQMQHIDNYLMAGKPVIGIRTSTHAFNFPEEAETNFRHYGNYYEGDDAWNGGFGRLVLGEKWIAHHGEHGEQSTRGVLAADGADHPVLTGVALSEVWGPTDVYKVRLPMQESVTPIVLGQTVDRANPRDDSDALLGMRPTDDQIPQPIQQKDDEGNEITIDLNNPMMPIVWSKQYVLPGGKSGKSFTSTIGASVDMLSADVRKLYVNATYWMLDLPVPENVNVGFIGTYNPTRFAFHDDAYWDNKEMKIKAVYSK